MIHGFNPYLGEVLISIGKTATVDSSIPRFMLQTASAARALKATLSNRKTPGGGPAPALRQDLGGWRDLENSS